MEYTIVHSRSFDARLTERAAEAAGRGQVVPFLTSFREVMRLLQRQPHDTGELQYHAPIGAAVHKVAHRPVTLTFALHDQHHRVWLLQLARMSAPGE